jgi:hypothetical protein
MKTMYTSFLVGNRTKWMLMSLVLAVVLLFTHQDATADLLPVNLGSAGSFGVLAGNTIASANGGKIHGGVGVWPGTGFAPGTPPVIVTGIAHLDDLFSAQAQADLTIAYNNAAGRPNATVISGNLSGQTLAPGLYKSLSSFAITSGDLTLDAQDDPNAVWIFQMPSTLTVGSGHQVILTGGAQARNIFWQVGGSVILGGTSAVKGNILAHGSITMGKGAILDGSALALSGAVTLNGNTITRQPLHSDQPWRELLLD